MMDDWTTSKTNELILNGILFIGDGYRAKNSELASTGIPFARAGNINGGFKFENADYLPNDYAKKVREKLSKPGDIVFTSKGTVGRFAFVLTETPRFVFSPQICCWRSLSPAKLDPRFLFYWMQSREFFEQVETLKGQTDMADYVSLSDQRQMTLTIPKPNEQRAIAGVLSSLDDKIDLLQRQNKTLEAMAETLFRQWFVEEANDDWEEVCVGNVAKLNASAITSSYKHRHIFYLDTSSLTNGIFGVLQPLPIEEAPSRAKRLVKHNDILISTVRPDQCHYGIVKAPKENLVVSTGFCVITATNVDPHFLYLLLTGEEMTEFLHSIAEGSTSTYPSLKPSDLAVLKFRNPPKARHDEFARIAGSSWDKIACNSAQICSLEKLRDTLLPKLMSGEVRVQYE